MMLVLVLLFAIWIPFSAFSRVVFRHGYGVEADAALMGACLILMEIALKVNFARTHFRYGNVVGIDLVHMPFKCGFR